MNESLKELADLLSKSVFHTAIKAQTKAEVLAEIADILVAGGTIAPAQRGSVHAALVERDGATAQAFDPPASLIDGSVSTFRSDAI